MFFLDKAACKHTRSMQGQSNHAKILTEAPNTNGMCLLRKQERYTDEPNRATAYQYNTCHHESNVVITGCIG